MVISSYPDQNTATALSPFTWIGLAIALFGLIIVRQGVFYFYPKFTAMAALWRESLDRLCVIALFLHHSMGGTSAVQLGWLGHPRWKF